MMNCVMYLVETSSIYATKLVLLKGKLILFRFIVACNMLYRLYF